MRADRAARNWRRQASVNRPATRRANSFSVARTARCCAAAPDRACTGCPGGRIQAASGSPVWLMAVMAALGGLALVMAAALWQTPLPSAGTLQVLRMGVAVMVLLSLAGGLLAWAGLRAARRHTRQAATALALQREAMDAMETAVVLWDPQDRLVFANQDFLSVYGAHLGDVLQPGVRFEDALRATVAAGLTPEAQADPEAWIARRVALRRQPAGPLLRELPGGRWRRIVEQRLSDGSVLAHSVDVSELVQARDALSRAQQSAEQARQRLADAVDALPASFELYDAEDRLVLVNRTAIAMYPLLAELAEQHPNFEEIVRNNHARGGLPFLRTEAELEAWLAQRQRGRRAPGEPWVQELPGGRWVRTHERRTREGGLVGVRFDVTDAVQREQALAQLNRQLDGLNSELARLSDTDALTGLGNRRLFDRRLAQECARASRHGSPLALLMLDVDHFKRFNDHHGHPAGDACLQHMARLLAQSARRPGDLAARLGGEEFVLLLPHLDAPGALASAQHCHDVLAQAALMHGDSPQSEQITVSVGVAVWHPTAQAGSAEVKPAQLLALADAALYQAKREGRARSVLRCGPQG